MVTALLEVIGKVEGDKARAESMMDIERLKAANFEVGMPSLVCVCCCMCVMLGLDVLGGTVLGGLSVHASYDIFSLCS